jgi:hypothetical protein
MGAASDHVVINLTIQSSGLARNGYGKPLILSHTATFPSRTRDYSSVLAVAADFASTTAEYRAANVIFAQQPHPTKITIGRAAGTVTQRYDIGISLPQLGGVYTITAKGVGVTDTTVTYTALADLTITSVANASDAFTVVAHGMTTGDGPYRLSNSGGGLPTGSAVDTNYWIIKLTADTFSIASSKANAIALTAVNITSDGTGTHTLQRQQNDVIIAQLVQGLSAVVGANFTTVQTAGAGQTDTLRSTASAANGWFSLEVSDQDLMSCVQSHAAPSDVTLATDLDAILRADQSWYCLLTNYNSSAYVRAAEAWTEANTRIYVWDSCDTAIATTVLSGGTDVGALSFASGYGASMGEFHTSPADFAAAGWMGRWLPTDPGKATPKFKTLALVRPIVLTDTHKANIRARRMNSYEQVLPDRAFTWEGSVFSNVFKFLDVRRNSDWTSDQAQKAILGVLVGSEIVPETPAGVSKLAGALRGVGDLAFRQGVFRTPGTVTAPDFDTISDTDLADRNLPGLVLSAAFAGAIHTVIPVDVVLTF